MAFFLRGNLAGLTFAVWLVFAALATAFALHAGTPGLMTDDAMRLAQVRDLLAGQSWFDLTQHRMNAPYGLPMHWTRVVDAGIGGLILLFRPLTGPASAESAAIALWPLLTLLPALLALTRIASKIGGARAGVIVLLLAVTCVNLLGHFLPGAIDHHNLMIALTLWSFAFLLDIAEHRAAGIGCALACAFALAVGLEALPYIALTIAAVALLWLRDGDKVAPFVRGFGTTLAAASAVLLIAVTDSHSWFTAACDTYSGFYANALAVGGLGLAAVTYVSRPVPLRAAALAGVVLAALGAASLTGTACFAGPYAQLDPRLNAIWLARITEAQSAWFFAHYATSEFIAGYGYAFAGTLAAVALALSRLGQRAVLLAVFAAIALGVATLQIRAVPYAIVFGLPALAVWLARLLAALGRRRLLRPVAGAAALIASCDASFAIAGGTLMETKAHVAERVARFHAEVACAGPQSLMPLATLPPASIAAFSDQGPGLLAYTRHAVIAGPYHRDASGLLDTYAIFTRPAPEAQRILKARGIGYVVTCTASRDWTYYRSHSAPDGVLLRQPRWLETLPTTVASDVRIYRVRY